MPLGLPVVPECHWYYLWYLDAEGQASMLAPNNNNNKKDIYNFFNAANYAFYSTILRCSVRIYFGDRTTRWVLTVAVKTVSGGFVLAVHANTC